MGETPPEIAREHARLLEILEAAGLPKHSARVALAVATAGQAYSAQIEKATGLAQPQVSVAVKDLMERKWLTRQAVRREGRGRPVFIYKMRQGLDDVAKAAQKDLERRIAELERDAKEVRAAAARVSAKR